MALEGQMKRPRSGVVRKRMSAIFKSQCVELGIDSSSWKNDKRVKMFPLNTVDICIEVK